MGRHVQSGTHPRRAAETLAAALAEGRTMHVTSRSVADTWRVAAVVAKALPHGGAIALRGELGAGKTTFVQGLARAMGIKRPVTSPTFALVGEYDGAPRRLVHMDLFRIGAAAELLDLGFAEYLERGDVVAVEWAERAADAIPADALQIEIACAGRIRRIAIRRGAPPEPLKRLRSQQIVIQRDEATG